ncbi:MAG: type II secretion system F family protein, partial [Gammaproteobacteria bacterium]|nr:type II secretion system F family protein [Gammaproteobacteria bacterium]
MTLYHFKAVTRDGETIEEERESPSEMALMMKLQEEGLLPIKVQVAGTGLSSLLRF